MQKTSTPWHITVKFQNTRNIEKNIKGSKETDRNKQVTTKN